MARLIERPASRPGAQPRHPLPSAVDRRRAGAAAGRPATAALRIVAGGLVIAAGAIHLYLYQDYFSAVPTIGRLFLANFAVALVLGLGILVRPRTLRCLLGAGFCLATLGAFLVSVHWGLFGYQETLRGAWQERAAGVEVAGAIACTWLGALVRR